jgi:hypothetical protein
VRGIEAKTYEVLWKTAGLEVRKSEVMPSSVSTLRVMSMWVAWVSEVGGSRLCEVQDEEVVAKV